MNGLSGAHGDASLRRALLAGLAAAFLICLSLPATGSAATMNETNFQAWNGESALGNFGDPNTATYGQTITIPAGQTQLYSFTFYPKLPTGLIFRAYVYAWDGETDKATGPALYESADMHTTEAESFQPITATTGGIPVVAGGHYVIFFSTSKNEAADANTNFEGEWGLVEDGASYEGGETVWLNNGYHPNLWTEVSGATFEEDEGEDSWDVRNSNDMTFAVEYGSNPPAISSVTPDTGIKAGTVVSVVGDHFTGASEVLFGSTPASAFTVSDDGTLTATAPAGISGTVDVRVITPSGESAVVSGDQVTAAVEPATPVVKATAPAAAPVVSTLHCIVPKLRGLDEAQVASDLAKAHCKLGHIDYHYSSMTKGGLVEQDRHQGTILAAGSTVDIWLSRGAHRRHKR